MAPGVVPQGRGVDEHCRDANPERVWIRRLARDFCTSASACVLAGTAVLSLRRAPWLKEQRRRSRSGSTVRV